MCLWVEVVHGLGEVATKKSKAQEGQQSISYSEFIKPKTMRTKYARPKEKRQRKKDGDICFP